MTEAGERALLPNGLQDILPPQAAHEAEISERLIAAFASYGYERIKLPLMEFETSLLSGTGAAVAEETFRLMDPLSRRMVALRADMTPQVVRVASSRLGSAARPLRLCYGGQVLRTRGTQLRPERQVGQAGIELIGATQAGADAEVVLLAAEALGAVGVEQLSIDLTLPPLVRALCAGLDLDGEQRASLTAALERKDSTAVEACAGDAARLFLRLLRATGRVEDALPDLADLDLPDSAGAEVRRLREVVDLIRAAAPGLMLTVDPVEHRGFEYQTGISFAIFARQARGELGRGGRYVTRPVGGAPESSTGFTLYLDTIMRALPEAAGGRRLLLPTGTPGETARSLRAEGWACLAALEPAAEPRAEGKRLGCSHIWLEEAIHEL